jgi:3-oxoacyl-[acyl-carrier-protein] synthase-1
MVTGVGLNSASSCAAIRCAIDNFSETRFMDKGGEWIIASQVPLAEPWRGLPKLIHMAVPAIRECLAHTAGAPVESIPLLLCIAEKERPGRLADLDDKFFAAIEIELGSPFHPRSGILARGRVAGALALAEAGRLIHSERIPYVIIAGADSYLTASTLAAYEQRARLLTSQNSNGFIPGEAAAAVLVSGGPGDLHCLGIGLGQEQATVESETPLRAQGLTEAFKAVFADSGIGIADVDYRITGLSGEQYFFKEAELALARTLRVPKEKFQLWHPADCIGEIGAAIGPVALAVALAAARKDYQPGPVSFCHFSADDTERAAFMLRASIGGLN